jgi:hypothetical protein
MNKVVELKVLPTGSSNSREDCVKVLESAKGVVSTVLIIGKTPDGESYVASNTGNKEQLLMLVERFKFKLMNGDYD